MQYDVLVLGGGPAGLSAALSLGRMSRSALVCDDGRPRNAPAEHMNNFPSHDGLSPKAWREKAKEDLRKYQTIALLDAGVSSLERSGTGFRAEFTNGEIKSFRKVILAHGIEDRLSEVPGVRELWGKSIYHCPYCHGYEVKGQRLGVVINGAMAEHMVAMIYSLSPDTILFTNGPGDLTDEFKEKLNRRNVRLVESKITAVSILKGKMGSIILENGETIDRDGLFWAPSLPYKLKSDLGVKLGCELTNLGLYNVNDFGKTTVDGVFAAGDISRPMHSVLMAASAGQLAGAAATGELLAEDFSK